MLSIVAGILHLSNVTFEAVDADTGRMSANPFVLQELRHAARLLQVDAVALQNSMEEKMIETRNERVKSPLSVEKAVDARNSMAKAMYGRMFDWLVQVRVKSTHGNGAVCACEQLQRRRVDSGAEHTCVINLFTPHPSPLTPLLIYKSPLRHCSA